MSDVFCRDCSYVYSDRFAWCPDCGAKPTPPVPTTEPTAKPITGLTEEEIKELWIEHGLDECNPEGFAQIITRALAEKNGLAVQGGE